MFSNSKIETIPLREFLAGSVTIEEKSLMPLYGFMGLDMHAQSIMPINSFNAPYTCVFIVAGVAILSTLIEKTLISKGKFSTAERVASITSFLLPVAFYSFLIFGITKVFY
ncbi:hypothetical protein [Bacillus infantis]|uniref:hypothetical protein n=1 Tax=Bacillus infantis TaxID=324767 RepID=UPI003CF2624F